MLETKRVLLKAYILPHQKEELKKLAAQSHISTSQLVSRLVTGKELPDINRDEDILSLARVNADQARLGNLLKMAIDDGVFEANQYNKGTDVESLILEIRRSQIEIKNQIKIIKKK